MEGVQTELGHLHEDLRNLAATVNRLTGQVARVDDVAELRERVVSMEYLPSQVSTQLLCISDSQYEQIMTIQSILLDLKEKQHSLDDALPAHGLRVSNIENNFADLESTLRVTVLPTLAECMSHQKKADNDIKDIGESTASCRHEMAVLEISLQEKTDNHRLRIDEDILQLQESVRDQLKAALRLDLNSLML